MSIFVIFPTGPGPVPAKISGRAGFGLLEATAVLFVTAMLVGLFTREMERSVQDAQIDHSRAGILIIAEALYAYRINELDTAGRPKREWPGGWSNLNSYAPNFAGSTPQGGRNGVGQPYSLLPPAPLNSNDPMVISTDMLSADYAELLRREFPGNATVAGTTVSVEVPVPGHEPARDSLLALDGSRPMSGNLALDTHDISDADRVGVQTDVNVGNRVNVTREVDVGTRITVGGNVISSGNVGFLNGAYGEACLGGVAISGGSTSCFTPTCAACTSACPCPPCPPPPVCPPSSP